MWKEDKLDKMFARRNFYGYEELHFALSGVRTIPKKMVTLNNTKLLCKYWLIRLLSIHFLSLNKFQICVINNHDIINLKVRMPCENMRAL